MFQLRYGGLVHLECAGDLLLGKFHGLPQFLQGHFAGQLDRPFPDPFLAPWRHLFDKITEGFRVLSLPAIFASPPAQSPAGSLCVELFSPEFFRYWL